MSMSIVFRKDEPAWRAYVEECPNVQGFGSTPEEALGWLIRKDPGLLGRVEVMWPDKTI